MKYKGVILVLFLSFSLNFNLFSQVIEGDSVSEVSCQFYLDTALKKQVYLFADKKAEFPGGEKAMMQFISKNIIYPKGDNKEGSVFIEFVINEEGKIIRKAIRKSVHREVDEEALRVIDKLPKFIPAQCDGKVVPFLMVIPIKFMMK